MKINKKKAQIAATKGSITFDNIPTNALLLLKDISKGEECRPFTFVNGKQTWW